LLQFGNTAFIVVGYFFVALLHTNPTMMRGHPLLRFSVYWDRFKTAQAEIKDIAHKRSLYFCSLEQFVSEVNTKRLETKNKSK
jgi:hypothetical protein